MSSALEDFSRHSPTNGGACALLPDVPLPRRLLKAKELAALLDIDPRHLRRLQNGNGQITPLRRPGSCRIVCYPLEEVARLVVVRTKAGKGFNRSVAQEFGYLPFVEAVAAAAETERLQSSPARFGEVRLELMIDVLVSGHESTLARAMGLTAVEVGSFRNMAAATFGQLFRELPQVRQAVARQLQGGLVSLGIRHGQMAAKDRQAEPILFPVACGTNSGGSGEPSLDQPNLRPRGRPARATGG